VKKTIGKENQAMDEPIERSSDAIPNRPNRVDWGTIAIRAWMVVLLVVGVIVLIKMFRRGGAGIALAVAAPTVAAASIRRRSADGPTTRPAIDEEFLKTWLARVAVNEPLLTPAELCAVLNSLFRNDGRAEPFDSPMQMARELKKLGLQSSVRSVPGRSERRWYDLTGYGTHEASA
jgi:hypothetical protein